MGGRLVLDEKTASIMAKLLGRIVHDLNNPLAAILGFSELLKKPDLPRDRQERYRLRIHEQAAKLAALVESMSHFSNLPQVNAGRLDLGKVVGDVAALRRGGLEASGIELTCSMPGGPLPVKGDVAALVSVLASLLSNVEQVFKETAGLSQKRILLSCYRSDGAGVVDVLDSGPGVPPEDREEIFAPFFSTRRSGGLGLGLTVSRGLMERMGGSLKLVTDESHELPGALFRLSLPEAERL